MVVQIRLFVNSAAGGRGNGSDISVNAAEGEESVCSCVHSNLRRYLGLAILNLRLSLGCSGSSSSSRFRLRAVDLLVLSLALCALVEEDASFLRS